MNLLKLFDACNTANEMWTAIERLQQGESLNIQDVKTNLFWEFGKFTSRDGESMESYYSRDLELSSEGIRICKRIWETPCKVFQELYNTTNINLRTYSNSRNKTEDTTTRYNNDNQSGQCGNQRTMTVAGARETVGSQISGGLPVRIQFYDRPSEKENKTILKQLKKANASLTQELKECRTNLDETGRALGEATSCRDSCLIALQNKQNEFEKYKAFNDRTIDS
ncbi:hypothetical protein Tco_0862379 [Tanacetum coccineum]